jgi:CRP-like cAMP-binding protein
MTAVALGRGGGTRSRWRRRAAAAESTVLKPAAPLRILFGNRSIASLVVAFAGVTIAEWGYVTALAVSAYRDHGAIAVGLIGLRLFFAALGSIATVSFVHRRPGGRLLTQIAVVRAVLVATSAGLVAAGVPLAPLLVLVTLDAIVSSPYRPAQSALIPTLARTPTELAASAAGLSTVKTLSQALGAVLGGFLLEVVAPQYVLAGAAAIFLGAAAVTLRFRRPRAVTVEASFPVGVRTVMRDTVKVARDPHVTGILVASGLRTFVRGMWVAIAVIASLRFLHAGSGGVGLLMLAAAVGSLVAVPLSAKLIGRSRIAIPTAVALLGCGIPLGIMAGIPGITVAVFLVAAWGVGMAVADVATSSLLFRLLAAPLLPRVTGVIESSKLALEGLGALLAPVLVTTIGVRGTLLFAALPLPILVVSGWRMLERLDASASDRTGLLNLLHGVPCLQPLDVASLESLTGRVARMSYPANIDVIRQGDPGDRFYIVESGTADVLVDGFVVGVLGPGDGFGEKALLRNVERTATVKSSTPMELLTLSREEFLAALGSEDAAPGESLPSNFGDANLTRRGQVELLSRVSLLSHLDWGSLGTLADRSVVDKWPGGATIVRSGEEGDRFFVLLEGRAEVLMDSVAVGQLHPGDQFGEIALLYDVPRRADVAAIGPVVTLSLHRDDFVPAVRSRMLHG